MCGEPKKYFIILSMPNDPSPQRRPMDLKGFNTEAFPEELVCYTLKSETRM